MRNFRAGLVSGHRCSVSSLALATLIAGLPGLAQAQLTGITQSGSVFASSTVIDRSPQGMYTNTYRDSATLANLSQGMQSIATTGVSGASAGLSTTVSPDTIRFKANLQATNGLKTFYDPTGSYPIHTTDTSSSSSANLDIRFDLSQTTSVAMLDISTKPNVNAWSLANLTLSRLDLSGTPLTTYAGASIFGLTSLESGHYRLKFSADMRSDWGFHMSAMTGQISAVPEPATSALLALGGLMLVGVVRRQKR